MKKTDDELRETYKLWLSNAEDYDDNDFIDMLTNNVFYRGYDEFIYILEDIDPDEIFHHGF